MYPILKKVLQRDDDYGDSIKPEEYLRAEERGEDNNDDEALAAAAKKDSGVGEKRKWDEVGTETALGSKKLANGAGKRRKTDDNSHMDGVRMNGDVESEEEDDDEPEEKVEGPVKAILSTTTITLALRLAFVDFSGYYDKRSIQYLIPLIKPRKLILIGGEAKETSALAADCRQLLQLDPDSNDISTPLIGDIIDASVDTNAWTVMLSKSLYKRLRWQNVRGLGVVALSAFLLPAAQDDPDESSKKKLKLTNGDDQKMDDDTQDPEQNDTTTLPLLDVFTAGISALSRTAAQPIHVGDIRLADLRRALQAEQYTAEFRGEGTLVINNSVAVRKSATGRLEVEGLLALSAPGRPDSTFFDTRRKVYDMLAVVSGA